MNPESNKKANCWQVHRGSGMELRQSLFAIQTALLKTQLY